MFPVEDADNPVGRGFEDARAVGDALAGLVDFLPARFAKPSGGAGRLRAIRNMGKLRNSLTSFA